MMNPFRGRGQSFPTHIRDSSRGTTHDLATDPPARGKNRARIDVVSALLLALEIFLGTVMDKRPMPAVNWRESICLICMRFDSRGWSAAKRAAQVVALTVLRIPEITDADVNDAIHSGSVLEAVMQQIPVGDGAADVGNDAIAIPAVGERS